MFVRWKITRRAREWKLVDKQHGHYQPVNLLAAYLVESTRIEGKPRQKIIAYLGSIKDTRLAYVTHQHYFWTRAQAALHRLGLPGAQRWEIERKLLVRVPMPSQQAYEAEMERLWKMVGTKRRDTE